MGAISGDIRLDASTEKYFKILGARQARADNCNGPFFNRATELRRGGDRRLVAVWWGGGGDRCFKGNTAPGPVLMILCHVSVWARVNPLQLNNEPALSVT